MSTAKMDQSLAAANALVRGELASGRKWLYRAVFIGASGALAIVLTLWTTEPSPLPVRLHVAFGAMTLIACGWIIVLSWVLTRRYCPTAMDRIVTTWMATIGCSLFLAVGLPIALLRGQLTAALCLSLTGFVMLGIAIILLRGAYAWRTELQRRLAEAESADGVCIGFQVDLTSCTWSFNQCSDLCRFTR